MTIASRPGRFLGFTCGEAQGESCGHFGLGSHRILLVRWPEAFGDLLGRLAAQTLVRTKL